MKWCLPWITLSYLPLFVVSSLPSPRQPNFVLILTDDLDLTLGGVEILTKTKRLIGGQGAVLPSWFVHTPVCCPSRAELLTGKMFHNLKVADPGPGPSYNAGCMHVDVSEDLNCRFYSRDYFARYFKEEGYTVGVFGKHLNQYNPSAPPPGVDRWLINNGGNYLDPSFSWASAGVEPSSVQFNNCTGAGGDSQPCYSTSVIGNASISWLRDHLRSSKSPAPFFAYVSVKAPHLQDGPGFPIAIPAPWYANAPVSSRAPRTPSYNASCPRHHWLVRQQPPLTDLEGSKVDELYESRLRALLSVDDLVEDMVSTLQNHGVLDNTYILFTSDNGYRLGQFRMPQGKFHPYENDIRVPFMISGPEIRPGSVRDDILGTHVDIIPTLLGLVRGLGSEYRIPPTMDGENLAPLLTEQGDWQRRLRTVVLIEYLGLGPVWRYGHLEDTFNNTFRALRMIDPSQPQGFQNLKYVEFVDLRENWNFTGEPAEYELFDVGSDPFEMNNIIASVPDGILDRLRATTRRLFTCSGESCRDGVLETAVVLEAA